VNAQPDFAADRRRGAPLRIPTGSQHDPSVDRP